MRHRMSGHVLAAIYLFINCIYNVVIMWYVPSQLKVRKFILKYSVLTYSTYRASSLSIGAKLTRIGSGCGQLLKLIWRSQLLP